MQNQDLLQKYAVPVPRYTSYPTVPFWDNSSFNTQNWINSVTKTFNHTNALSGISLYIHLPYCESLCTYCGCNTRITKNHEVEVPYLNAVIKEWQLYKNLFKQKPIIKEIHLGGGTPTFFNANNLQMLINGILAQCDLHPEAEFSFEAHPANTSQKHLETLFKLGFKRISLGIQDFDIKVQQIINRFQTVAQVQQITEMAKVIGYTSINYDLIYGLPLQTEKGLCETIVQVVKLKPNRIAFYGYAHVPWVKPGQRMFTDDDLPNTQERKKLYELGREMLVNAGYEEIGMDHFALKTDSLYKAKVDKQLHRNFMGYTHQYTSLMIGLGVSSISDTWTAFAQNVKKVEDYLALVNEGEIPVFKGHVLTEEDLLMRKHILNLMCKSQTQWNRLDLLNHNFKKSLYRLHNLETDGLLIKNENSLEVTPLGERFLRNICAAFDTRLHEKELDQNVFSMAN